MSHSKRAGDHHLWWQQRAINDGTWAMSRVAPAERIDWENHHRERTIALFGRDFYVQQMMRRVREALHGHS